MKKTVKFLIITIVIVALTIIMTSCSLLFNLIMSGGGETTTPTTPDGECAHDSLSSNTGYASPTCTEEGYYMKECMYCGELYKVGDPIPKIEHRLSIKGYFEGNCKENGYTGDLTCGICKQVFEEGQVIETIGIHHVDLMVDAFDRPGDCISNGSIAGRKCMDCNEWISDDIQLPRDPSNHRETKTANNVQYCLSCNMVTSGTFIDHSSDVHCCKIILPEATYCTGCGQIVCNPDCEHTNVKIYTNSYYDYQYTYCSDCFYIVKKPQCDNHENNQWYKCDNCGGTDCAHNNVIQVFNTLQCWDCDEILEVTPCNHNETTTLRECTMFHDDGWLHINPLTFCNGCGMFIIPETEQCDHPNAYMVYETNICKWLWCPDCKEYLNK